jgi:hypothetical protein
MSAAEDEAVSPAPVLFLIDPRAAASEPLRAALEPALEHGQRLVVRDDAVGPDTISTEDLLAWPDDRRDRIRIVMGTFPFGIERRWRRPVRYGALLREPMARIAALHASRSRLATAHGRSAVSLGAFVFDERHLAADNGQTRLIAGRRHVRFGDCDESLYEEAVVNVESHFEALLLAEQPARSVAALGRLLGLDLVAPEGSDKPAGGGEADSMPAPADVERVRELNAFDLRLHAYARHRAEAVADGEVA